MRNMISRIFDESNPNWTPLDESNDLFLRNVGRHMNNLLQIQGHVFLNEVYDALKLDRTPKGQLYGWLRDEEGINHVICKMLPREQDGSVVLQFTDFDLMYDRI